MFGMASTRLKGGVADVAIGVTGQQDVLIARSVTARIGEVIRHRPDFGIDGLIVRERDLNCNRSEIQTAIQRGELAPNWLTVEPPLAA
jgi:hypothetical protein